MDGSSGSNICDNILLTVEGSGLVQTRRCIGGEAPGKGVRARGGSNGEGNDTGKGMVY